jgi:hypothetical protein
MHFRAVQAGSNNGVIDVRRAGAGALGGCNAPIEKWRDCSGFGILRMCWREARIENGGSDRFAGSASCSHCSVT